jgi:hypothetical protein
MPNIYTADRVYLKDLCHTLQALVQGKLKNEQGETVYNCIINMPPRHGKTLTVELLTEWTLGNDPKDSFMVCGYNEMLSTRFAKQVRNDIQERKASPLKPVFTDIFPGVRIKDGDGSMNLWSLDGSHFSFLATSPDASMTGIGTRKLIIDDLIKNAKEAFNENLCEEKWRWYNDTALSRLEGDNPIQLIIQTRWGSNDLTGYLLRNQPEKWYVIKMRANVDYPELPHNAKGMLCDSILSWQKYVERKGLTDEMIFSSNYDQEPIDTRDKVYTGFKTYNTIPEGAKRYNYTDTADEGQDYLCSINFAVQGKLAYIEDILYTDKPMEDTEYDTADRLTRGNVDTAHIESNNGGRGFARAVERILREKGNFKTKVVMPKDWHLLWPKFHADLMRLGRTSKWAHDDAPDALTGVYEKGILYQRAPIGSGTGGVRF